MKEYKDYNAKTQQDRIALDTLSALEDIRDYLKALNDKLHSEKKESIVEPIKKIKRGGA